MSMRNLLINNIAIIPVNVIDNFCVIYGVSQSDVITLLENLVVDDKGNKRKILRQEVNIKNGA